MQLVAYGAQDIYLTGNPQITFFKVVYRRHTNFSMETISQTLNGNATIGTSQNEASCTISRNGDLIHKMYVCISSNNSINLRYGSEVVQSVELEIGGQLINKHTKEWNNVWDELTLTNHKALALKEMFSENEIISNDTQQLIQVPLNFWFCRNPGLSLPLIALQYHEVQINFVFGSTDEIKASSGTPIKFYVDYIYLDTDERRRFAQVSHEYLIEQVQMQSMVSDVVQYLNFNHPVKELIWVTDQYHNYDTALLKLNGHDRFEKQKKEYFQLRQPFDYHTHIPRQNFSLQSSINYFPISNRKKMIKSSSGGLRLGIFNRDAAQKAKTGFYFPTNFVPKGRPGISADNAANANNIAPCPSYPTTFSGPSIWQNASGERVGLPGKELQDKNESVLANYEVFYVFHKDDVEEFRENHTYTIEFYPIDPNPPKFGAGGGQDDPKWYGDNSQTLGVASGYNLYDSLNHIQKLFNPEYKSNYGFTKNNGLSQSVICDTVITTATDNAVNDKWLFVRFNHRIENIHNLQIYGDGDNDGTYGLDNGRYDTRLTDGGGETARDKKLKYADTENPALVTLGLSIVDAIVDKIGDQFYNEDMEGPDTKYNFLKIKSITEEINSSGLLKAGRISQLTSNINVYSFALRPEEHQPSGTCNFSRIDTATLEFGEPPTGSNGNIYAVNYNVLRIMSGMGGLAYSN